MLSVEQWTEIRHMRSQGKSIRQIATEMGLHRQTVRRALQTEGQPDPARARLPSLRGADRLVKDQSEGGHTMQIVGAYEAKTHLAELLDAVLAGDRVTITRHGTPVAMLVPMPDARCPDPAAAVQAMHEFRRGVTLGGLSLRDMIETGRP